MFHQYFSAEELMVYIYMVLAFALMLLLYMRFEAGNVKLERIELSKNKSGLKIMQLSDIHINMLKVPTEKIKKYINEEKPDFVIITGDYIDHTKHIPDFINFLKEINTGVPIHICFGNHDFRTFKNDARGLKNFINKIELTGVNVWNNCARTIEKGKRKYNIIGFSDMKSGQIDLNTPFTQCAEDAFMTIAFSHNPDIALALSRGKVDLLLCGHFHGGQIWTPFSFEFKMLRDDKLCKMGMCKGLHKVNGINVYINRGLGNVIFPLRFMSRPEITVLQLP